MNDKQLLRKVCLVEIFAFSIPKGLDCVKIRLRLKRNKNS